MIGPDKTIKPIPFYPMTTGRDLHEVLRVVGSLQLTANRKVSTPVSSKRGDDVTDERDREPFGAWESPWPYIRIVPQPRQHEPALG